jgi:hypothetical protein
MKSRHAILCLLATSAGAPGVARSQTVSEFAAWSAMIGTPVGAFAPLLPIPANESAKTAGAIAIRVGRWKLEGPGKKANTNAGVTLIAPIRARSTVSATLGYLAPGCATACEGEVMIGGDLDVHVWQSGTPADSPAIMTVWLKGSAGFGHYLGDVGGSDLSLVGSIPISFRFLMANKSTLSALFSPGFGVGRVSGGGDPTETGRRPLLGGGFGWTNADGFGVHVGGQQILVRHSPKTIGIGVSFNR